MTVKHIYQCCQCGAHKTMLVRRDPRRCSHCTGKRWQHKAAVCVSDDLRPDECPVLHQTAHVVEGSLVG